MTNGCVRLIDVRPLEHDQQPIVTKLYYSEMSKAIVGGLRSAGYGYHYTLRSGYYLSANYWGINQWQGQQIGNVMFLDKSGNPRIIFNGLSSPINVAKLANEEMRLNNG
ncbi:MAG TPA: hypothetical protein VFI73_01525 [Candidatus Nitrosopolaris sp.]|nr:hypothetical protein [Candidatus Nitrosopolaris sp.]